MRGYGHKPYFADIACAVVEPVVVALLEQHPEPGFDVEYVASANQDAVYRRLFKDELDALLAKIKGSRASAIA